MKKNKKIEIHCEFCKKIFFVYPCRIKRSKSLFCSKKCKSDWQKTNLLGENNPNFNNKWNDELRQKQSIISSKRMSDPKIREQISKKLIGRKFSEDSMKNYAEAGKKRRGKAQYEMTSETKNKIGVASAKKFTKEYNKKIRKINEKSGNWIPLNQKDDYKFYFKIANWIMSMVSFLPKKDIDNLNKIGMFNAFNNTKGYVRDHMYSRKSGFIDGVFPEILRHPANLQLISHSKNVSKRSSKYVDKDDITLSELFDRILNFKEYWVEQDLCLLLISEYNNGKRYCKEIYMDNYYDIFHF